MKKRIVSVLGDTLFVVLLSALFFVGIIATSQAQTVTNSNRFTKEGKTFTSVGRSKGEGDLVSNATLTDFTYRDSKANEYRIYLSKNGRAFIIRTSQRTGKEYKYYLGEEISKSVCKELGLTYVELKQKEE